MDSSEEELSTLAELLLYIATTGSLPASLSKLNASSSRGIPSEKDFFFYQNFQKFKIPINQINQESTALLTKIGSSSHLWQKPVAFPDALDHDDLDAHDWVVNANDDVFEKLDKYLDEFRSRRRELEKGKAVKMDGLDDGFQMVHGRKNRKGVARGDFSDKLGHGLGVGVAETKAKPKIPFHIPTIPKPQDVFKIIVNNSNQPFEHVWLQKSEDGSRVVHPLENLSVLDFVDKNMDDIVPVKPPPLEVTPFKLVEDVKDLKQLAAKLRTADEFAVDLEHNQYRSFQGLTCLMQISTRTEDFVIDTLKLRIHVGPYLREVFKDPTKKKVMHGADRDIIWLQKDFGIYVCNMFDTGQASRVLTMERYSLEHLLHHFCGVTANKEYQNADWRLRPLPDVMVRYAREDTHYLLYIYDMMRIRLLSAPCGSENADSPLVEVYKRSYDICMQLYEKELLTDSSFLHIYGIQGAGLNAQQLAVVSGLCEWRDVVARAEDESTGYVLPNKTLIEIAKQMPLTASKLHRLVKLKHPYIERNLGSVVSIIRHSIQNAPAFEVAAQQLKERQMERAAEQAAAADGSDDFHNEDPLGLETIASVSNATVSALQSDHALLRRKSESLDRGRYNSTISLETSRNSDEPIPMISNAPEQHAETDVTVQLLKKPSRGFGALLGSSARKKLNPDKTDTKSFKLEQIKSSVNLPFHSFAGSEERRQQEADEPAKLSNISNDIEPVAENKSSDLEQIIMFDNGSDIEQAVNGETEAAEGEKIEDDVGSSPRNSDEGEEPETISVSDLSSSFQECFQSTNGTTSRKAQISEVNGQLQLKPFDYEAAKNEVNFGEANFGKHAPGFDEDNSNNKRHRKGDKKSNSLRGIPQKDDGAHGPPQGKRRQAFPASGNRSATFR